MLCIFTGLQIEASFSMMNDIIDKRSSCMDIPTYGAIMNFKYYLIAKSHSSFQWYCRKSILYDSVNIVLDYRMRTANCGYTKKSQKKREETKKKSWLYRSTTTSKEICEKKRSVKRRISKGKSKRLEMVHNNVGLHSPWISCIQKPV